MESLLAFMDTNYKATKEAFERGIMYEVMKVRAGTIVYRTLGTQSKIQIQGLHVLKDFTFIHRNILFPHFFYIPICAMCI